MNYRQIIDTLATIYDRREATALADYMLDRCFNLSKADSLCGAVESLTANDSLKVASIVKRLLQHEPIQYIIGNEYFYNRCFNVRQGVLIPRPETEELCRIIIEDSTDNKPEHILDIGTGSGCIAITLALEIYDSRVTAWDISDDALKIARDNAAHLNADIDFHKKDILQKQDEPPQKWDIIVSNPPYVRESEQPAMPLNVLHYEPDTALFVKDSDPLVFYKAISDYASRHLRNGGRLYFEINEALAADTANVIETYGLTNTEIMKDIYGKERFIRCCKQA
ncbi:MAG: peptide chain release factor N(5)-glutamine methyltransferase [Prevotella sp.]